MHLLIDSFWRAVAYCLRPRIMLLSLLPLVLMIALTAGLGYFFWDSAMDRVRTTLESFALLNQAWEWLESMGAGQLKMVLVPLIVVFGVTPLIVVLSLLLVAFLMTPMMVALVARRRFPDLEQKQGASFLGSLVWSVGSTVAALVALVVSVPLWWVPPLILVLPPLIWGWLTYRVLAFDALAAHASAEERQELFRRHRGWLLGMGLFAGSLGAAPSLVWVSGVLFAAAFFVFLLPLAIWIYVLVFAFASLWFTHYCLAALRDLRLQRAAMEVTEAVGPVALALPLEAP